MAGVYSFIVFIVVIEQTHFLQESNIEHNVVHFDQINRRYTFLEECNLRHDFRYRFGHEYFTLIGIYFTFSIVIVIKSHSLP